MTTRHDVCIVGAGLIGLAVARALVARLDGVSIVVVDKEDVVAAHQSSRNSGVIHSGLYYRPGSLKARLCVSGREAMYAFAEEHRVPVERCGKLVIATHPSQVPGLDQLERRGRANGLSGLRRLDPGQIAEVEPEATGVDALEVPDAGVVDFPEVARRISAHLERGGARIATGCPVTTIEHIAGGVMVTAGPERLAARALVNCAGLHSDRVAALAGVESTVAIVPFRGEYYRLPEERAALVRALIYPVPDPRFPFLGVHFTRRIDGTVEVGPNAVLALGREHYRGTKADWADLRRTLGVRGFRRLARRHWRQGLDEMLGSRSRRRYARRARRLVPAVTADDLLPGGSGIRAQAVTPEGALVDDFVVERVGSTVHVLNAPSPGATASLAIGRHIAGLVEPILTR